MDRKHVKKKQKKQNKPGLSEPDIKHLEQQYS